MQGGRVKIALSPSASQEDKLKLPGLFRRLLPSTRRFEEGISYSLDSSQGSLTVLIDKYDALLEKSLRWILKYLGHEEMTISCTRIDEDSEDELVRMRLTPEMMVMVFVSDMSSFMRENYPDVLLIPTKSNKKGADPSESKQPWWVHSGIPTREMHEKWDAEGPSCCMKGLVLILRAPQGSGKQLIVIDVDSPELVVFMLESFPALNSAPQQLTTKGRHFFVYTLEREFSDMACKVMTLETDPPALKALGHEKKGYLPLDIKTTTLSMHNGMKTGGALSFFPSKGKAFEGSSFWIKPPIEMPDDVRAFLLARLGRESRTPKVNTQDSRAPKVKTQDSVVQESTHETPVRDDVTQLLDRLLPRRWLDRNSWRDIATALKNHDDGGDKYKSTWKDRSKTCPTYTNADAEKLWASVCQQGYEGAKMTIATIYKMARDDSDSETTSTFTQIGPTEVELRLKTGDSRNGLMAETIIRDEVTSLLDLLSKTTRWINSPTRVDLRTIATALKTTYGHKYRAAWLQRSRVDPNFDEASALEIWDSISISNMKDQMNTIEVMAESDDPIGYRMHKARYISPLILDNWDQHDRGLAIIAHHMLKTKIKKCGKTDIYMFIESDCRWVKCSERSLRITLSHSVEQCLRDVMTYYSARSTVPGLSDSEKKELDRKQVVLMQRIVYMRKTGGMNNVVTHLADMCQDDTFEQKLDSIPHLLGVRNGVIDLRTSKLRNREPEDMVFTVLDVDYDEKADDTVMAATVLSAMADDESMALFMQKLLGYGITGEVSEEVFPIFTGKGRNCKGVITQTIQKILGDHFYVEMNPGIICERQVANIDAERGKLLGARIAVFSELRPGEKLKTNEVQLLSGGDGIMATPKYKDPMTIRPRHLCILATNHMPEINPVIVATMERLLCINFPVTYTNLLPGEQPTKFRRQADSGLKAYLDEHKDQVLAWLVRGSKLWYDNPHLKRDAPKKVIEASNKYFFEQDKLAQFIADVCIVDQDRNVHTSTLLEAYNNWNAEDDIDAKYTSIKEFVKMMRLKGFDKEVTKINGVPTNAFVGIGIAGKT